jgi:membrane-bound acyltransferase YfiQ involved in biofilm formation
VNSFSFRIKERSLRIFQLSNISILGVILSNFLNNIFYRDEIFSGDSTNTVFTVKRKAKYRSREPILGVYGEFLGSVSDDIKTLREVRG